ncbi:MAG: hypothetical protein COS11_07155, partial [bacterium (Candidatus Ratteibacteria) CG01_land_8_20_14_3_00_40_19]
VFVANLLYGISKFPLTYVSSPQGERMEVRGLIYWKASKQKKEYLNPGNYLNRIICLYWRLGI